MVLIAAHALGRGYLGTDPAGIGLSHYSPIIFCLFKPFDSYCSLTSHPLQTEACLTGQQTKPPPLGDEICTICKHRARHKASAHSRTANIQMESCCGDALSQLLTQVSSVNTSPPPLHCNSCIVGISKGKRKRGRDRMDEP